MNDPAVHQRITADWSDSLKELLPVESFQFFDSVSSTNDVLLERAEANPDITTRIHLAVADFQTSGRAAGVMRGWRRRERTCCFPCCSRWNCLNRFGPAFLR